MSEPAMHTQHTPIDDETLCAFLDGELPAPRMADVRTALAQDKALAARLALLSAVDGLVREQARALDDRPLPASVLARLQADEGTATVQPVAAGRVLAGPWQQWRRQAVPAFAMAASVALAAVFGFNWLNPALDDGTAPPAYAALLDTAQSGSEAQLDDITLLGRFSFRNPAGAYCRQYQLRTPAGSSENIACRQDGNWSVLASTAVAAESGTTYQPASGNAALDALLDTLMTGPALARDEEDALIANGWQEPR